MWKFEYLLSVLSFFIAIVLISQLLRERRAPGSTVAWLLVMILIPYVGVPLFLLLGNRKLKRVQKRKHGIYAPIPYSATPSEMLPTERVLLTSGAPPKSIGNQVDVLRTGEDAYRALLQSLEEAKSRIHMTSFILKLDPVGRSILEVLERKARAGVEVRLLLDGLGSFWIFRWNLRALKNAGGKSAHFLPLIHVPFFGHSNLRNHRKLVVVDQGVAFLGGMNIAKEYMGPNRDRARWVDLSLRLAGPVALDLETLFMADWEFASGERLSIAEPTPGAKTAVGKEALQVVASGPDVPGDPLYDSIVSAIFDAKKRVWIATPYFIPDETLSKSLELAAKRGVDVRLLVPKRSNHLLADLCRRSYLRQLEGAGGQVFYHSGSMMHAKVIIVDHLYSMVGSANLDMRSLLLNFEVGLFIYSEPAVEAVCEWYRFLLQSTMQRPLRRTFASDLLDGLARILGPVL